ncbi:CapA family protein [Demequina flava]|uniref:CapA family protein n=1 Tax=Demequina flava TaxID=1095025 RepID=UPI000782C5DB|nr:CapA family protein [Demequina flava]
MPPAKPPAHARRHATPALLTTVIVYLPLAVVAGAVLASGLGDDDSNPASALTTPSPRATPSVTPSPTPSPTPTTPTVEFSFVAGGDVLTHMPVVWSATTDEGMDFSPLMAGVDPYVAGADLALCHLEYPVDTEGNYTGYPMFGGPAQLITDLGEAGWDGCSTASNHSVDRGYAGLEATIDTLEAEGMGYAGTARTEAESTQTQMYTVSSQGRDITVASVSWTYGLNGLPKPEGMPWSVNTFDADGMDAAPIIESASAARDQGADVVIASVHCCVEYLTEPTAAQRDIAEQIAASGEVDLYVGHHAHVPQPLELLEGGPYGDGMWTAFGLGNYLSNQDDACCVPETGASVLLSATLSVAPDGVTDVEASWTALTYDRRGDHTMHALHDIADEGAGTLSAEEAQARYARVADAVGPDALERTMPVAPLADSVTVEARG